MLAHHSFNAGGPAAGRRSRAAPGPNRFRPGAWPVGLPVLLASILTASLARPLNSREPPTPVSGQPEAREAARRVLVLRAVRSLRFSPPAETPGQSSLLSPELRDALEAHRLRTLAWLQEERLLTAATTREIEALRTPTGRLTAAQSREIQELDSRVVTLLWALGEIERLPAPDPILLATALASVDVPGVGQTTDRFVRTARLRPQRELRLVDDATEVWALRSRIQGVLEEQNFPSSDEITELATELRRDMAELGENPGPIDSPLSYYRALIRYTALWASREGIAPDPLDGDFPVLGRPFGELEPPERERVERILEERRRTMDWLLGRAPPSDAGSEAYGAGRPPQPPQGAS